MFVQRMVKDPEFAQRVFDQQALQEKADAFRNGYGPEQEAAEISCLEEKQKVVEKEHARHEEIRVIAQSLAYVGVGKGAGVKPSSDDAKTAKDIESLLREAYADEEDGKPEGFRLGEMIDSRIVGEMLDDESFRWITVEVANGLGIEIDGAILGVACYSMAGEKSFPQKKSREGVVGCNAALRFLAVRKRYRGLCVGERLLDRVKNSATQAGAKQLLACVPSPRVTVASWLQRRAFERVGSSDFPTDSLPFKVTQPKANILIFATQLNPTSKNTSGHTTQQQPEAPPPTETQKNKPGYDSVD